LAKAWRTSAFGLKIKPEGVAKRLAVACLLLWKIHWLEEAKIPVILSAGVTASCAGQNKNFTLVCFACGST
jgi:hypothetical protein